MFSDPLVPVTQRFPMLRLAGPLSDARPSDARPFALRFVVVGEPATVRHRTVSHQTNVPARTTLDGRQVPDDYTVPDD
ncbi:MAG TPA: hypothetical protein VN327_13850 [Pseudonocardiaceae bacterium]|jgi:hypothetical protein|nr:hypothetical protein [Pseudonocardiaceae bacterium]